MIPDEVLRRIRENVDIVEVAAEHLQLKKSGRGYVGLCPFHQEKTPSFHVTPDLGRYKCFGCHESGNVFDLIMKLERVDFPENAAVVAPFRIPTANTYVAPPCFLTR